MPEENERMIPARVLRAGVLGGREVKPDDLVDVPYEQAEGLFRDGAIDPHDGAVAYARSLVAPAAPGEPALEGAETDKQPAA